MRKRIYEVRMNTNFEAVMRSCAKRDETWINASFITTYTQLHYAGLGHSVEAWKDGVLVGGLYGVALGGAFMGESMFSRATDASKVCLIALVEHLKARGYVLHDVQFWTPHLATLGVAEIPRTAYERRLQEALRLRCTWDEQLDISRLRSLLNSLICILLCLLQLLPSLILNLRLLLNLGQPAEEQRRHHNQVNQPGDQQQGPPNGLIRKRGDAQRWWHGIIGVKHYPAKHHQEGKDIHGLPVQERIEHLHRVSHLMEFAYGTDQRPPVKQRRQQKRQ